MQKSTHQADTAKKKVSINSLKIRKDLSIERVGKTTILHYKGWKGPRVERQEAQNTPQVKTQERKVVSHSDVLDILMEPLLLCDNSLLYLFINNIMHIGELAFIHKDKLPEKVTLPKNPTTEDTMGLATQDCFVSIDDIMALSKYLKEDVERLNEKYIQLLSSKKDLFGNRIK